MFHGLPGSRLQRPPDASLATGLGARIITVDRPGFGLSTHAPKRRLLDWPDDVAALADALGIGRFAVVGVSAGAAYAAACALRIGPRLSGAAWISGVGPEAPGASREGATWPVRAGFVLARGAPRLLRPAFWLPALLARSRPLVYLGWLARSVAAADQAILAQPPVRAMFAEDVPEAFRQGVRGFAHDLRLLANPWGFRLQDIETAVQLWHGEDDLVIPVGVARRAAATLPRCRAVFLQGAGHFLVLDHWREILLSLVADRG